jgi:hypothetical protein
VDTDKYEKAYCFARKHNITTLDSYEKSNPDGYILRKHLAKMMVNFKKSTLDDKSSISTKESCKLYNDINDVSDELK